MNNKGFTLVELLAVIVIIAVLGGIATYGVVNAIKVSKDKAEDAFLNEIGKQIEMYIDMNSFSKDPDSPEYNFSKVITSNIEGNGPNTRPVSAWEFKKGDTRLTLRDILENGYSDKSKFENPNNEKECNYNNEIIVFRDEDYVYYYYVDFNDNNDDNDCVLNGKIINTIPRELICESKSNLFANKYPKIKAKYNAAPNVDSDDKCTG